MSCDLVRLERQIPTGCFGDMCSVEKRVMGSLVWLLLRPERLSAGSIAKSWIYASDGEACDVCGMREVSCECAMMLCWLLGVVAVLAGPSDGVELSGGWPVPEPCHRLWMRPRTRTTHEHLSHHPLICLTARFTKSTLCSIYSMRLLSLHILIYRHKVDHIPRDTLICQPDAPLHRTGRALTVPNVGPGSSLAFLLRLVDMQLHAENIDRWLLLM